MIDYVCSKLGIDLHPYLSTTPVAGGEDIEVVPVCHFFRPNSICVEFYNDLEQMFAINDI